MKVDVIAGLSMWLIEHRKLASEDAFISRLSELVVEAMAEARPQQRRATDGKRKEFMDDYLREYHKKGKRGWFTSLVNKHNVSTATARSWISKYQA